MPALDETGAARLGGVVALFDHWQKIGGADQLRARLAGIGAEGIVDESETLAQTDLDSLLEQTNQYFERVIARGVVRERLLSQSLVTTMTNLANLTVEEAERAMGLVFELSQKLREPISTA